MEIRCDQQTAGTCHFVVAGSWNHLVPRVKQTLVYAVPVVSVVLEHLRMRNQKNRLPTRSARSQILLSAVNVEAADWSLFRFQ